MLSLESTATANILKVYNLFWYSSKQNGKPAEYLDLNKLWPPVFFFYTVVFLLQISIKVSEIFR